MDGAFFNLREVTIDQEVLLTNDAANFPRSSDFSLS